MVIVWFQGKEWAIPLEMSENYFRKIRSESPNTSLVIERNEQQKVVSYKEVDFKQTVSIT